MKVTKHRVADYECEEYTCCRAEEDIIGERDIQNAKQRAIYHHKQTGHTIHFVVQTIYTFEKEK